MIHKNTDEKWRFWPNIVISLIFALNNSVLGIAIPILYAERIGFGLIGIVSSALTMTYSFSPLIFIKISEKIGKKRAIIISTIGVAIIRLSYYISLEPVIFLITRLMEGLFLGLLFPNLISSISSNPNIDHSKYLARFNLSWNIGMIIGFSVGALFLFLIPEILFIFYISPILSVANGIIGVFFFKEPKFQKSNSQIDEINIEQLGIHEKIEKVQINIPNLLPFLLLIGFTLSQTIIGFLFPLKSKILDFEPFSVYLLSFCAIIAQTILVYYGNLWNIKRQKSSINLVMPLFIMGSIFFAIAVNYWMYLFLYVLLGIVAGVLYGTLSKFFIMLNIQHNTSKYSNLMESFTGISFFITQISLGFIADRNVDYSFITCSIITVFLFIIVIKLVKQLKFNEEDAIEE